MRDIPLVVLLMGAILWDWYEITKGNIRHRYISKPLSVALIIVVFLTQIQTLNFPVWVFLIGLLLGLLGDILLLFYKDTFFIIGLASFLLGHIAYIIGFMSGGGIFPLWGAFAFIVPVAVIVFLILRMILPYAEKEMKTAVLVYGIVIGTLLYSTLCLVLKSSWNSTATILAIAGAALFVTSDMLLAKWKFMGTNTEFWPMVTYHAAQIAIGAAVVIQFAG